MLNFEHIKKKFCVGSFATWQVLALFKSEISCNLNECERHNVSCWKFFLLILVRPQIFPSIKLQWTSCQNISILTLFFHRHHDISENLPLSYIKRVTSVDILELLKIVRFAHRPPARESKKVSASLRGTGEKSRKISSGEIFAF